MPYRVGTYRYQQIIIRWHIFSLNFSCINRADYIKVHDGRTASYPAIGLYCNQASYVEILSTGPELYIEFVSHSVEAGQGFKAKFQFQNGKNQSIYTFHLA